jgi:hypothetical protein
MARRGGRRGGQGNRGRRSKANRSRSRSTKSSSRSKSTSSSRRGGQGNKSRATGRAKGTVSRKSVGKGLRSVAKAAGKAISKTKGFAGVGSIASAARAAANKVKQSRTDRSSKQARQQRRADRLKRQFGLDTQDMRKLKINVDVNRTLNHLGVPQAITKRLPKSIRDFRYNAELGGKFRSPHKLGVREGYRAPNRGGRSIAANTRDQLQSIRSETPGQYGGTNNWLDFYRPENQRRLRDQYTTGQPIRHPGRIDGPIPDNPIRSIRQHPGRRGPDQFGPGWGIPGRPPRGLPQRQPDTIAMMYENILGRKADQGGLDYWKNELSSGRQTKDDIRRNIIRSDEFKGRSDADKSAALDGVKRRQATRGKKVGVSRIIDALDRKGIKHSKTGSPPRRPRRKGRRHFRGRAKPTGRKPTGRGLFPSIAASMAARGF